MLSSSCGSLASRQRLSAALSVRCSRLWRSRRGSCTAGRVCGRGGPMCCCTRCHRSSTTWAPNRTTSKASRTATTSGRLSWIAESGRGAVSRVSVGPLPAPLTEPTTDAMTSAHRWTWRVAERKTLSSRRSLGGHMQLRLRRQYARNCFSQLVRHATLGVQPTEPLSQGARDVLISNHEAFGEWENHERPPP